MLEKTHKLVPRVFTSCFPDGSSDVALARRVRAGGGGCESLTTRVGGGGDG
jgi:hypothetical protein